MTATNSTPSEGKEPGGKIIEATTDDSVSRRRLPGAPGSVREAHVTARIERTEGGELNHEYVVGGVTYGSIGAIEAALRGA